MANRQVVTNDAQAMQIYIGQVSSAGAPVDTAAIGSISIKVGDLSPDGSARDAIFRWFYFLDANNSCTPMKMLVLCTAPEAA
jgi:hypothetical protein